jgi:hypothetical protein
MKKSVFVLTLLGSMILSNSKLIAQAPIEPGREGVCCASSRDCDHPRYGKVAESSWVEGAITCS